MASQKKRAITKECKEEFSLPSMLIATMHIPASLACHHCAPGVENTSASAFLYDFIRVSSGGSTHATLCTNNQDNIYNCFWIEVNKAQLATSLRSWDAFGIPKADVVCGMMPTSHINKF